MTTTPTRAIPDAARANVATNNRIIDAVHAAVAGASAGQPSAVSRIVLKPEVEPTANGGIIRMHLEVEWHWRPGGG